MKSIIPQKLLSSAPMTSTEHWWWDDVEARPTRSKTEAWMAGSLSVSVDFGRNRRPSDTIASALYHYRNCYSNCCRNAATIANAILKDCYRLKLSMCSLRCPTIEWRELLELSAFYTIGIGGGSALKVCLSGGQHLHGVPTYGPRLICPIGFFSRKL